MKVPPVVRMTMFAAIVVVAWPLEVTNFMALCALLAAYTITK